MLADRKNSSVENALLILKSFSLEEPEMGVTELAEKLGVAKSTIHRLVSTMASEGFVYKNPYTNRYSLGASILALTHTIHKQITIIQEATPVLNLLTEKTGESSYLAIVENKEIIYLSKIEGEYPADDQTYLGKRNPLHCTSSGQVILAFLREDAIGELLEDEAKRFTANTLTTKAEIGKRLQQVARQGYALCDQEFIKGIVSISAPVRDEKNEVIAAVTITGPVERLGSQAVQKEMIEKTVEAGKTLSEIIKKRRAGRSKKAK